MLCRLCVLAESDEIPGVPLPLQLHVNVPRSGFIHEWQRDALQGGRTGCHDELSIDALCELALHARLFTSVARRAGGQGLELLVQRLRILAVL